MPTEVSIVIPNWNGAELLREHLPALKAVLDEEAPDVETIVVDDGSQDESLAVLENEFPWVRVVVHEQNRGFGPACLSGVQAATARRVFLLNSDVHVLPGFLRPLVAAFEADPSLFSAAAVALSEDGVSYHDTLRRPIWSRGNIAFEKLSEEQVREEFATGAPRPTLFATGGHALVDRERFLGLGGFSPLYHPFYWEDIDLGYRAWKRGWPTVVVPTSRVIHQDVGTIRTHFEKRGLDDVSRRNRYLFTWQNITSSRMLWTRHLLPLSLKVLTRWLVGDRRFYQVLNAAVRRRPAALRGRSDEKAAQVLTDEEVWRRVRC
ncbi:MAG: glycosyltransferase family 2 protein [Planctomycetota bacterium]